MVSMLSLSYFVNREEASGTFFLFSHGIVLFGGMGLILFGSLKGLAARLKR